MKSRSSPSMLRSVGEATSVYNTMSSGVKHGTKTSVPNSTTVSRNVLGENQRTCTISNARSKRKQNIHRRSASVGSSIDFDKDESKDQEEFKNSRFSKVNDTITKSKKFSHLHMQPESSAAKSSTIDHSSYRIPPCDEHVQDQNVVKCECADMYVKKSVLNSDPSKSCQKCAERTEINSRADISNVCSASHPRTSLLDTAHTNTDCRCAVSGVVPAQKYTTCVETIPIASQYGAENDSGASTIVDQSSNSVTSLASVSTLIEGQNLSQDISQSEESNAVRSAKEPVSAPMHNTDSHLQGNQSAENTKTAKCNQLSSETFTISSSSMSGLPDGTVTDVKSPVPDVTVVTGTREVKAMRCIKFDNIENYNSPPNGILIDFIDTPVLQRRMLCTFSSPLNINLSFKLTNLLLHLGNIVHYFI